MFGILNETILAVYALIAKLVRVLPALIHSRGFSLLSRDDSSNVEIMAQQEQKNEFVRRLLSCLGIEIPSRVPVKVRSNRSRIKRR